MAHMPLPAASCHCAGFNISAPWRPCCRLTYTCLDATMLLLLVRRLGWTPAKAFLLAGRCTQLLTQSLITVVILLIWAVCSVAQFHTVMLHCCSADIHMHSDIRSLALP